MAGFAYLDYDQSDTIIDMSSSTNTGTRISALTKDDLAFGTLSLPFLRYMYMETAGTLALDAKHIRNALRHVLFNPCGTVTHFSWPAVDEIFRLAGYPKNTASSMFGVAHMHMSDPVKRIYLPERASVSQNRAHKRQLSGNMSCASSYHSDMSSSENRRTFYDVTKGDISDERLTKDSVKIPIVIVNHTSITDDDDVGVIQTRFSNVCKLCTQIIFLPSTRCRVFPFRKGYLLLHELVKVTGSLSGVHHHPSGKRQKRDSTSPGCVDLVAWANAIKSSFSTHLLAGYWINDICKVIPMHIDDKHTLNSQLLLLADTFYISPWLIVHTHLRFGTSLNGICNAKLTDSAYIDFCDFVHTMKTRSKSSGGYTRKYCIMLQQAGYYRPIHTKCLMLLEENSIDKFDPEIVNVPVSMSSWVVTVYTTDAGLELDYQFDWDRLHRPVYCHIMDDNTPHILDWRRVLFLHLVTTKRIRIEVCPTAPKNNIILPEMKPFSQEPSLDACRCIPDQINSSSGLPDKVNICLHNAHTISWELLYMIWRRMVRQLQYNANIHCTDFDTAERLRSQRHVFNITPILVLRLQGSITLAKNYKIPNYASYNKDRQVCVGEDFLRLFTLPNTTIIKRTCMTRYREHGTSLLVEDNDNDFLKQCASDPSKIIVNGQSCFNTIDAIVSLLS